MTGAATAVELNPALAKDYPRPIREAYVAAVRRSHMIERHQQLLRLGEVGISYLASLAFADYRQARRDNPDPAVEEWLAGRSRLTGGEYLRSFRLAQKASGHPEMFGIKRYEVDTKLPAASRLAAAVAAVDYAQRVGARDVRMAIEEGLKNPQKGVRWLRFWDDFIEYRNRVIHAHDKGWPVEAAGYYESMTPLLEAALVEALTTEYIGHVLLEHPVAQLRSVTRVGASWNLALDGEYLGAPLIVDMRRAEPPSPWESEVGASYVLGRGDGGEWRLWARFYNFKEEGVPVPVETGRPPVGPADHRAEADEPHALGGTWEPVEEEEPGGVEAEERAAAEVRQVAPQDRPATASSGSQATGQAPAQSREPWFPAFSLWMLWGALSFGLLAVVGFLWAATRTRDPRLRNWGLAYGGVATTVLTIGGIVGDSNSYPVLNGIGMALLLALWSTSTVHALAVNPRIKRMRT